MVGSKADFGGGDFRGVRQKIDESQRPRLQNAGCGRWGVGDYAELQYVFIDFGRLGRMAMKAIHKFPLSNTDIITQQANFKISEELFVHES
jgi:hypothetical protein